MRNRKGFSRSFALLRTFLSVSVFLLLFLFLSALFPASVQVRAAETDAGQNGQQTAWYSEYTDYVLGQGYMSELSPGDFGAEEPVTRAMLTEVLFRMWGGTYDRNLPQGTFSDVDGSEWFSEALSWAYDSGIIRGAGGKFDPQGPVDRETAAVMIQRASPLLGIQPASDWSFSIDYTDLEDISEWAVDGIAYCSVCGIMSGDPDGSFAPGRMITRAEAAAVIWRIDNGLRGQDVMTG